MDRIKKALAVAKQGDMVVLSDSNVDTAGDIIDQDGWELEDFKCNPVMFYGHSWDVPIGTWSDVAVTGGRLIGKPVFADVEGHAQAQLIKRLWDADVLKTVSVSFMPMDAEPMKGGGMHYHRQRLLEVSVVPIPANPNAHKLALKALGIDADDAEDKGVADIIAELDAIKERLNRLEATPEETEPTKPEQAEAGPEPKEEPKTDESITLIIGD